MSKRASQREPTTDLTLGIGYYRWGDTAKVLQKFYPSGFSRSHNGYYLDDPFLGEPAELFEGLRLQLQFVDLGSSYFFLEGLSRKEADLFLAAVGSPHSVPSMGTQVLYADGVSIEAEVLSDTHVELRVTGPRKTAVP